MNVKDVGFDSYEEEGTLRSLAWAASLVAKQHQRVCARKSTFRPLSSYLISWSWIVIKNRERCVFSIIYNEDERMIIKKNQVTFCFSCFDF